MTDSSETPSLVSWPTSAIFNASRDLVDMLLTTSGRGMFMLVQAITLVIGTEIASSAMSGRRKLEISTPLVILRAQFCSRMNVIGSLVGCLTIPDS